jgi:hypothetical protein
VCSRQEFRVARGTRFDCARTLIRCSATQGALERVRRSPLPDDRKGDRPGAARSNARGETGVRAGASATTEAARTQGGTQERKGGIAWEIKW